MQPAMPAFFSPEANNLDASSKLPFFPPNFTGNVRVDVCKGIVQRDGARAFIAEMTVLESNLPAVSVGSRRSWFQSLKEVGTGYPACIGFLYACLGVSQAKDQAKIDSEIKPKQDHWLNLAISDSNPLGGTVIRLDTSQKDTKAGKVERAATGNTNKVYTIHTFSPVVSEE